MKIENRGVGRPLLGPAKVTLNGLRTLAMILSSDIALATILPSAMARVIAIAMTVAMAIDIALAGAITSITFFLP